MRALITGGKGQLAQALSATAPKDVEVTLVDRLECDVTDIAKVRRVFRSVKPSVVINTAAYTAVDAAEMEEDLAFDVNARGPANVAGVTSDLQSRLIHISTDYVFDGQSSIPYSPAAPPNPLNVYGATKLEGEKRALAAGKNVAVIRTSWLYSASGRNFLTTILDALKEGRPLSVVNDQVGTPTSAHALARTIWKTACIEIAGVFHWANSGLATWYEVATEIRRVASMKGLADRGADITPVTTDQYQRTARRPPFSALDPSKLATILGIRPVTWTAALEQELDMIAETAHRSTLS